MNPADARRTEGGSAIPALQKLALDVDDVGPGFSPAIDMSPHEASFGPGRAEAGTQVMEGGSPCCSPGRQSLPDRRCPEERYSPAVSPVERTPRRGVDSNDTAELVALTLVDCDDGTEFEQLEPHMARSAALVPARLHGAASALSRRADLVKPRTAYSSPTSTSAHQSN